MKNPYNIGEVLFNKEVDGTSFTEELEVASGYYKLWVIAQGGNGGTGSGTSGYRGGAGSGGEFFGIVKLQEGKYKFRATSSNVMLVDPENIQVINSSKGSTGETDYGEQGIQGSGGTVNIIDSKYISVIRPFTMAGLGGIVRATSGVINQGYQFYEEVESFGQGANGSKYNSTVHSPENGIIKLVYIGNVPKLQENEVFFGAWGNQKENKSYILNFPEGIYKFRGISQGGYGGYNGNGYNIYYGGGGSSGYYYEAYFRLKGEYQIDISATISFSKPGESNYFTLNKGEGGGYGTAKLHYAGGSAPTMTKGDNISEILEKEITSTSQGGNGNNAPLILTNYQYFYYKAIIYIRLGKDGIN